MWCEIAAYSSAKKGRTLIRLQDDDGNEVRPRTLQDLAGNKYTAVYKPEWEPFFELRPSDKEKEWAFKDRIEVLD